MLDTLRSGCDRKGYDTNINTDAKISAIDFPSAIRVLLSKTWKKSLLLKEPGFVLRFLRLNTPLRLPSSCFFSGYYIWANSTTARVNVSCSSDQEKSIENECSFELAD